MVRTGDRTFRHQFRQPVRWLHINAVSVAHGRNAAHLFVCFQKAICQAHLHLPVHILHETCPCRQIQRADIHAHTHECMHHYTCMHIQKHAHTDSNYKLQRADGMRLLEDDHSRRGADLGETWRQSHSAGCPLRTQMPGHLRAHQIPQSNWHGVPAGCQTAGPCPAATGCQDGMPPG